MANLATLIVVALLLAIFQQVSAASKEPKLCAPLGHPDWDCTTPIICEKDWPSETGNYGLRNGDANIRARSEPLLRILFLDSEINSTAVKSDIHRRRSTMIAMPQEYRNHSSGSPLSKFWFPEQCCRLTVECFKFFEEQPGIRVRDHNGRIVVDDFNVWKKAECCMSDFLTPKSWCLFPPARNSWFSWDEPPACTKFH